MKFDSKKWKHSDLNIEENAKLRWDMMNDLRNNHHLKGMTNKEVVQLLGEPDDKHKQTVSYYLGYTGTGINTGTLHLIFDANNRVTQILVWQG